MGGCQEKFVERGAEGGHWMDEKSDSGTGKEYIAWATC